MAASFSARATLMNWFRATPSASASLRASSSSDFCTRNAKLLLLIRLPQFPKRLTGRGDSQVAKVQRLEIAFVKSDQQVRPAIQGCFEDHIVVRTTKHGPPTKIGYDRFQNAGERVQQLDNLCGL